MPADGANPNDQALDQLFQADNYLYFHDTFMPPARRALETALLESALGLNPGLSVLDLACGHGRHANRLAPLVRQVTGIDRSPAFLDLAAREAAELGISNVRYQVGDIRDLGELAPFDRIMLVNTVFGLFDDAQNDALLSSISRTLASDGRFIFDVINRDMILSGLSAHGVAEKDGDFLIDRLEFSPLTGRMTNNRIYIRRGVTQPARFSLRLYNLTELTTLLTRAGLETLDVFGGWGGEPFEPQSKKIILVAGRA